MNEVEAENYFAEESSEEKIEEPSKQTTEEFGFLEGICSKCLDTGFIHTVKDGVLGVCYTSFSSDGEGSPVKKLMVCTHGMQTNI